MISSDAVRATIRRYIFEHYPAAKQLAIGDEDSLLERNIIDSLGVLDLVTFLEAEFSILIADDELEARDFESIAALASFVSRRLGLASATKESRPI